MPGLCDIKMTPSYLITELFPSLMRLIICTLQLKTEIFYGEKNKTKMMWLLRYTHPHPLTWDVTMFIFSTSIQYTPANN